MVSPASGSESALPPFGPSGLSVNDVAVVWALSVMVSLTAIGA